MPGVSDERAGWWQVRALSGTKDERVVNGGTGEQSQIEEACGKFVPRLCLSRKARACNTGCQTSGHIRITQETG